MINAGIIRCQQTEDMCPGTTDFKVAGKGILAFKETGPAELVGFVTCGGCPVEIPEIRTRRAMTRAVECRASRIEEHFGDITDSIGIHAVVVIRCIGLAITIDCDDTLAFYAGVEASDLDEVLLAGCNGERDL